jgi:NADH dehydrogenase FAD-containing subunit
VLCNASWQDLQKSFPNVPINDVRITLVEAGNRILSAFDQTLVNTAMKNILKQGATLVDSMDDSCDSPNAHRLDFDLLVMQALNCEQNR